MKSPRIKFLLLLFCFLVWTNVNAQFFKTSVETYAGANYFHSVRSSYEAEPYQGVESLLGFKLFTHLGNNFSLSGGFGFFDNSKNGEYYGSISAKCNFLKNYLTGFSVFIETGVEIAEFESSIPFYLGTTQNFGNGISFNFRLRVPTFLDVRYFYDCDHFKIGIELGLQFDIPKFRKPVPLTVFGNPFILD